MAQMFIVPKQDYEVIRKYLFNGAGMSTILVPEDVLNEPDFPKETANKLRALDGQEVNYDFGGEPDVYLDIVTSKDHYSLSSILPDPAYSD